ncbi:MAG: DNA polymerase Y family protein [Alphaproteobacteria bacterium]|nr:DNA polymerase Y family protein [Alphaproteobacteria bacterium]
MESARRYLALWLPFLSTDRVQRRMPPHLTARPDDLPLVLVEKLRGALRIAALNRAAAVNALKIGMSLADARAIVPDIRVGDIDPEADKRLTSGAAAACEMFTPLVAIDGADGLLLDITGCAHLFGGEEELLLRARRRLEALGLTARAAIAGTPDSARAFVRFTRIGVVESGGEEGPARALPVTALGRDAQTTIALTRAGLKTLGDLADRPSHLLSSRFGEGLVATLRRILGYEDIRITPLRPPPEVMAERHFPEPLLAMESLLGVLEKLAGDLMTTLEKRGAGGRAYEASFFRADGAVRRITLETAQGTRDVPRLMRLIGLKIEALADPLDPGFGFDALRLTVIRSEPLHAVQRTLAGGETAQDETRAVADLVDRLVARFGRENVRRFIARDTHDPVLAGGTVPCLSEAASAPWPAPDPGQPPLRPLTLFTHPQWIEVMAEVPDSPPLRFRWRRVLHEVTRAEGPERVAPEWWREGASAPATRDYYRVEDANGHRFWIFREGLYEDSNARPRWFLHGLFA